MKILKVILLYLLIYEVNYAQIKTLEITTERNKDKGYVFKYTKSVCGTYCITVKLKNANNVLNDTYKQTVNSYSGVLFTVEPADRYNPVNFSSYSYSFTRGIPNPKIDTSFVYAMPFPPGKEFAFNYLSNIKQVYFKNENAPDFKAFNFSSPSNDTACSVRKGIVIQTLDKYEMDTTLEKSYTSNHNFVLIEQPDGTLASYSGFKKGAIFVKEGQTVYPYTPLGLLAHYDSRKMYDLRLMIYFNKDVGPDEEKTTNRNSKSPWGYINPEFLTPKGVTRLSKRETYKSVFNEYVFDREMTKGELRIKGKKAHAPKNLTYLKDKEEIQRDSVFLDEYGNEVATKDEAYRIEVNWIDPANVQKRYFRDYYPSGKFKEERMYISKPDTLTFKLSSYWFIDKKTGVKWHMHGNYKVWYEDGKLKRDIDFRNGNIDGKVTTYWENGRLKRTNRDEKGNKTETKCFDKNGNVIPTYPYSKAGEYLNGKSSLDNYLATTIIYPRKAIENGLEGMIEVEISVDTTGTVKKVNVLKSADPLLDDELTRAILNMPKWRPALLDGEKHPFKRTYQYIVRKPHLSINWIAKLNHQDTTYYDKTGRIVSSANKASTYEILKPDNQHPDKAIEMTYYISGKLKSEKRFSISCLRKETNDSTIQRDGIMRIAITDANRLFRIPEDNYKEWFENGQLKKEVVLSQHRKTLKIYYGNGKLRRDDLFENGKLIRGKCYDLFGNETSHFDSDADSSFPGGNDKIPEFIKRNFSYPEQSKKNKSEGTIDVKFAVNDVG